MSQSWFLQDVTFVFRSTFFPYPTMTGPRPAVEGSMVLPAGEAASLIPALTLLVSGTRKMTGETRCMSVTDGMTVQNYSSFSVNLLSRSSPALWMSGCGTGSLGPRGYSQAQYQHNVRAWFCSVAHILTAKRNFPMSLLPLGLQGGQVGVNPQGTSTAQSSLSVDPSWRSWHR